MILLKINQKFSTVSNNYFTTKSHILLKKVPRAWSEKMEPVGLEPSRAFKYNAGASLIRVNVVRTKMKDKILLEFLEDS